MTRLEKYCKLVGWQGGTIHQANKDMAMRLGMTWVDILNMTEDDFNDKLEQVEECGIPESWFK